MVVVVASFFITLYGYKSVLLSVFSHILLQNLNISLYMVCFVFFLIVIPLGKKPTV